MFEGSLVESRGLAVSATQRWTAVGSATLQFALAGFLVAIPLLRPQSLPVLADMPRLTVPLKSKPPVVRVRTDAAASSSTATSAPAANSAPAASGVALWLHPTGISDGPEPNFDPNLKMGEGPAGLGNLAIGTGTPGPMVTVAPARKSGPVVLSKGVTAGMLLAPIQPVYPAIARAAGVQGTVMLEAVISKAGRIESLRAVSGPAMLRGAALDAVSAARYRPYLLNGEPTEVQTTVTVVFRLGS
jgi:protein TonB